MVHCPILEAMNRFFDIVIFLVNIAFLTPDIKGKNEINH